MYNETIVNFLGRTIKAIINDYGCKIGCGRSRDKDGYIWFLYNGHKIRLHRAVYMEEHGALPNKICVRHICDNKACFELSHLLSGTAKDNANDREAHGCQIHGEQVGTAKLTEAKVEAILISDAPIKILAEENGVSKSAISSILNGKTWKHIERPANSPRLNRAPDKPSIMGVKSKTKVQEFKKGNSK